MTPWASRSRGSGLVSRVDRPLSADRLSRAGTLTSLFARSVARAPKAVAVTSGQRSLTYGELDAASDRLARVIVGMDVVAGERVAVAARRSIEGLVGFVGVLKAGAAYVPVDPSDPPAHTGFILEDTAARCVLVGPEGLGRLDAHGLPAVPLGAGLGGPRATGHDGPHPGPGPGPGDLAYVVYTSGSSGRPKGVMIEHRQVLARVEGAADLMPGPGEGMLQVSRLDFDAQTWEIWGALASGARLVVVPPGDPDPDQVAALIVDERVGVALLSPGLFRQMAETHLDELGRLRLLLVGGDVLSPSHAQRFVEAHPGRRLVNLFGPTEVTVCGSSYQVPRLPDHEPVPVGRALGNTSLYILDDRGDPVSPGEPGELYIGGGGVGRGYLNRASDTAERFLDDPFGPSPGGRMYRTGDRVRLRPDGEMAFLGRDDAQAKIRGFRVEPAEVEACIRSAGGVKEAVVTAREDLVGHRRLVAYVVLDEGQRGGTEALREFVADRLPAQMVPSAFVALTELPRTDRGKIDRAALPRPADVEGNGPRRAPDPGIEAEVAGVWAEVLGLDRVGADEGFLELGGDSLLAVRVVVALRERLGVDLALRAVFDESTVAGLCRRIERSGGAAGSDAPELPPVPVSPRPAAGDVPVTMTQAQAILISEMAEESVPYQFGALVHFHGRLDVATLEDALGRILERHELLHTRFVRHSGNWHQVVVPAVRASLPVVDLSRAEDPDEAFGQLADALFAERIAVDSVPLIRWRLVRLADDHHVLVHSEHHVVHDGWSWSVFLGELAANYRQASGGVAGSGGPLAVQFADFARWQAEIPDSPLGRRQLAYWTERLADPPPPLALPSDRPRPLRQSYRGDQILVDVGEPLARRLRSLSDEHGVTVFMTMLSGFVALLARLSGHDEFIVGTGVANRRFRPFEGLIGMLLNTVALRVDLGADPTVAELLEQVRTTVLDALANQDLPFEEVLRAVGPRRQPGVAPLYQVLFSFQDPLPVDLEIDGLSIVPDDTAGNGSAKADLNAVVINRRSGNDSLSVLWEYSTDLFDESTARAMLDAYLEVLGAMVADPATPVSALPVVPAAGRAALAELAGSEVPYERDSSVAEVFEARVDEAPDDPALVWTGGQLTYGELDRRANRLAHRLGRLGAGPGTRVALVVDRSAEAVVALLGVLKAGGAYVALDPALPALGLEQRLVDAQPAAVCTLSPLGEVPGTAALPVVRLDDPSLDDEPDWRPRAGTGADAAAYLAYTSGTSGTPKAVTVAQRGVVRLARSADYVTVERADTLLQLAPLSFDASTFEIWGALLNGARLAVAPPGALGPHEIEALFERFGVTTAWMTAGLFHRVVDTAPGAVGRLRQLLAGGDVLSPDHVARALRLLPAGGVLVNGYGPTEGTTFTCCHAMVAGSPVDGAVPIGRPVPNTYVYVVDGHGALVPPGFAGELVIGGDGVALGYHARPELTAERFVPDRFGPDPTRTLYRSGDRVRWRPDGTLEWLGRLDRQVKIRGFRVEPEAVERALLGHRSVGQAVVVVRADREGDRRLVAYVTPADGRVHPGELRSYLEERLAPYEVPSALVELASLPLTANGKVDLDALDAPDAETAPPRSRARAAPTAGDPLERQVLGIWERCLGVAPISVDDDFFDLGGHSLLAIELFTLIEDETGVRLPLATIFEAPTVRQMTAMVRSDDRSSSWRSVAPVTAAGSRPPLFFVTAGDGNSVGFGPLSRRLGPDQPFYALQPPGLDGRRVLKVGVEAMARDYLDEVRSIQRHGPYIVGGRCVGTLVAYEMTRLLEAAGEPVALLIALDSVGPLWRTRAMADGVPFDQVMNLARCYEPGAGAARGEIFTSTEAAARFEAWLRQPVDVDGDQVVTRYVHTAYRARPDLRAAYPLSAGGHAGLLHWAWVGGRTEMDMNPRFLPEPTEAARRARPSADPRRRSLGYRARSRATDWADVATRGRAPTLAARRPDRLLELAARMVLEYRTGPISAPVVLARSEEYRDDAQLLRWHGIQTGGIEEHYVDGSHESMMREPDVASLARCIEACVDRCGADGHAGGS